MESAPQISPARYIAHLDMDALYASVELLRYPQLRGQPVVVGGRRRAAQGEPEPGQFATLRGYTGRGVITTSTYEARALGVFSGMGLMKAAKLAPDALLLPADFEAYRKYSRLFKDTVRTIASQVEDRGIDEIYIDLTEAVAASAAEGTPDPWARARSIAIDIQRSVREVTGLSCSVGITPNKLLSKIASELNKPGGVSVVRPDDIRSVVWPLAVRKINGIVMVDTGACYGGDLTAYCPETGLVISSSGLRSLPDPLRGGRPSLGVRDRSALALASDTP